MTSEITKTNANVSTQEDSLQHGYLLERFDVLYEFLGTCSILLYLWGEKIGPGKHKGRNKEGKYVFKFKSGGDESSFIFGQ